MFHDSGAFEKSIRNISTLQLKDQIKRYVGKKTARLPFLHREFYWPSKFTHYCLVNEAGGYIPPFSKYEEWEEEDNYQTWYLVKNLATLLVMQSLT